MQATMHSHQRLASRASSSSARLVLLRRPAAQQRRVAVRGSDDEAAPAAVTGSLFELTKDNFWEYLKGDEQKGKLVVIDCYTDWCGPCKMIYPELVKMSGELEPRATIVKFNCNKYNKELGVQLKIKVAPTFLLFRDGDKVGEMTGAKVEKLRKLITEKLDAAGAAPATVSMEAAAMSSYSQQPE